MDLNTAIKRLRATWMALFTCLAVLLAVSVLRGGVLHVAAAGLPYRMQTFLVLVAVAAMPVAWKLMQLPSVRRTVARHSDEGVRSYVRFSTLRMLVVATPAMICFAAAGLRLDDTLSVLGIMLTLGLLMMWPSIRLYRHDTGQEE